MSKCLNCDTKLKQTPGKRAKQFCNSTCRSNYWQKQARKKKAEVVEEVIIEGTKSNDGTAKVVSKKSNVAREKKTPAADKDVKAIVPAITDNSFVRPKTLEQLKKMVPAGLTGLDRSSWISTNRKKYNI